MACGIFLLSVVASHYLYPALAVCGLGWLGMLTMATMGGLGVYRVIVTVVNAKTKLALEANLNEIRTLLKFSTVARAVPGSSISPTKKKDN